MCPAASILKATQLVTFLPKVIHPVFSQMHCLPCLLLCNTMPTCSKAILVVPARLVLHVVTAACVAAFGACSQTQNSAVQPIQDVPFKHLSCALLCTVWFTSLSACPLYAGQLQHSADVPLAAERRLHLTARAGSLHQAALTWSVPLELSCEGSFALVKQGGVLGLT